MKSSKYHLVAASTLIVAIFLCLTSLIVAKTTRETIELAENYLLTSQNRDGGWPLLPGKDSDVEITALVMQALLVQGHGTGWTVINRGMDFLIKKQRSDGSWSGNTAHTIFVLTTLHLGQRDPKVREKGLTWLSEAQNSNGSWGKQLNQPGNVLYTGAVLSGLRYLVTSKYTPITKSSDWLANQINPIDGYGWSMKRGTKSDVIATSWVLQGISLVYDVNVQLAWLKQQQNQDNGFPLGKGKPSDPEITAYAILALVACQDQLNTDKLAIGYLKHMQQKDGSVVSQTPIELNVPKANLQTTSFALLAIHARKIKNYFHVGLSK
ncbi:TPA: hypothetical protein EYM26_08735 [Candidatus Poribacteria bacterium]|nr:hypothetical protein [Candidatus Poribacteria bacterium]